MIIIPRLVWDSWNVAHIARHHVVPQEVDEVCHSDPVARAAKKGRLLIIGPTLRKRMLAVVLDKEKDGYYVETARPADRKERWIYRHEKGSA